MTVENGRKRSKTVELKPETVQALSDLEQAWAEIDARVRVSKIPENGRNLAEMMEKWGLGERQTRNHIAEEVKAGRLEKINVVLAGHVHTYYVPKGGNDAKLDRSR